jgi:RNA polymerase-binding transcription factor DksA
MQKKHKKAPAPAPKRHAKAATTDVLDRRAMRPAKVDPKWETQFRHLNELRDYFVRQKGVLTRDANEEQPNYSEHMADAGTDSYDRDFALSILSSDQNALYEIDEALRRIEAGTYGICELTGKPIGKARLEAIPWARFSIEAEKQLEQNGVVNRDRARLGSLGSLAERGESAEEEEPGEHEAGEAG